MATAEFEECPAFPADVPVADLPTVAFAPLEGGSEVEGGRLFAACQDWGFFLLDLRGSAAGEQLLAEAEGMHGLTARTLTLDDAELDRYAYDPPRSLCGYKRPGRLPTRDGGDATAMYTLGQDDLVSPQRAHPAPIEEGRGECSAFVRHAHAAAAVVLGQLDQSLDLPPGTLAGRCPLHKESETSVRLLLTRPTESDKITLPGHTDIGVITLLFHTTGGLQVLPPGAPDVNAAWRYVQPRPGCALVNLGDTIVQWTGGLLRSSIHRVVTAPGPQAAITRRSCAYLIRPERAGSMRRLRSSVIPPLESNEEDETRGADEWAAGRVRLILDGVLQPQSVGGIRGRASTAALVS